MINYQQYSLLRRVRYSAIGRNDPGQMLATAEMMDDPLAQEAVANGWITAEQADGDTVIVTLTPEGWRVMTERDDA